MMKLRQKLWLLFILLTALVVLISCENNSDQQNENNEALPDKTIAEETQKKKESGGDLIIATPRDPVSLSPQRSNDRPSANIVENIYETLVTTDQNGDIQPGLAKWEQVDEITWDFYLKEGIMFHDETELNADVVKTNFDRLVDEAVASPYAFLLDAADSWEVIDEFTFRIHLKYPFPKLPNNLAHNATAVMSPEIIDEDYKMMKKDETPGSYIDMHPAGTGPFQFEERNRGETLVLSKHDDYWGDPAALDSIVFKTYPDQNARMAELESDSVHIADAIAPNDLKSIDATKDVHIVQEADDAVSYIGFNVQKTPFDDKNVRQAVSMAINRQNIIEDVYDGTGEVAKGPMPSSVFEYDDTVKSPIRYNVEKAEKLLSEAGYEDGFTTTIWTDELKQHIEIAESVQSQLGQIGVDVKIETFDWQTYLDITTEAGHDMFIMEWVHTTGDAAYDLYPLFHSSKKGEMGNRSFLENDELDIALESARAEPDPDVRQTLYTQVQDLLVDLAPVKFLHHKENLLGVMDTVNHFSIDAKGVYQLKDAYIEE